MNSQSKPNGIVDARNLRVQTRSVPYRITSLLSFLGLNAFAPHNRPPRASSPSDATFWERHEHDLHEILKQARTLYVAKVKTLRPDLGLNHDESATLNLIWARVKRLFAKRGIALCLLLSSCLPLHAQLRLEWDAADQATGYDIFQHTGTNWNLIGQTNGLSFPVTNRFQSYGIIATIGTNRSFMEICPGAPRQLRITNVLQSASSPAGPWTNLTSVVWEVDLDRQQFFRGLLTFDTR